MTGVRWPLVVAGLAVVACAPPETQRVRGGGAGADVGNRSTVVSMHAGSVIYPTDRCMLRGVECTGPIPARPTEPRPMRPLGHDRHVLDEMGRGGALRRVIYLPPPDLAVPTGPEMEPAQPGPGTGEGDGDAEAGG